MTGKPKAFGDTKTSLTKRSRGVCGCFHLTALTGIWSQLKKLDAEVKVES